ncbi:hypothetical protein AVEN_217943-1 [Araneus ventricosus]|uniref:Uncharacterized protein n=1 Tax=Araneus ventricosus TaxID=182803 RepID=A0A4Y2Q3S5_ARAVE|nr:hypothetical protein AVEN_217943-1 [Araneus ventricosus]
MAAIRPVNYPPKLMAWKFENDWLLAPNGLAPFSKWTGSLLQMDWLLSLMNVSREANTPCPKWTGSLPQMDWLLAPNGLAPFPKWTGSLLQMNWSAALINAQINRL